MAARAISGMDGLEELLGVLRELPPSLQKNALSSIARAGAVELRKEAMTHLALVLGRSVSENDVVHQKRRSPRGSVQSVYEVGPPRRKFQLRMLHDGTSAHYIGIDRKFVLASDSQIFGDVVLHPGQSPRPWLLRAFFTSRNATIRAMAKATATALKRQTARLRSEKYRNSRLERLRRASQSSLRNLFR